MDVSPAGQAILTYLYNSIFVEADKWGFIDPTINGIDCGRWAAEKGIDEQELITTMEDLYADGLVRVLFYHSIDAGLTAQGIEVVERSGLADPDLIAYQRAVRAQMLETLATRRQKGKGKMRTADLEKATGITHFALTNNGWYLDRIGFIEQFEAHVTLTDKGFAEARHIPEQ